MFPPQRTSAPATTAFIFALIVGSAAATLRPSDMSADTTLQPVHSLRMALANGSEHASRWLDEQDYKSVAQSTGAIVLLGELLKAKSDDKPWQRAHDELLTTARELQAAARQEDRTKCMSSLAALDVSIKGLAKHDPNGKPLDPPKAAIRPLMLTLDSIQADAKVALLSGNVPAAKNQALVLAELARVVSNSRTTQPWSALAADFQQACDTAAKSKEADPKALRQLFRGVAERCEACHEKSRRP